MENYFEKALQYHLKNKFVEAEKLYNKSIEYKLNIFQSYNNLGLINYAKKNFVTAEKYFKQAITSNHSYIDPHNNLAVLYSKLKNYELAIQHSITCLKIDPNNINILINLGNFLSSTGKLSGAKKIYLKVINLDKKNKYALNNLGSLDFDLGLVDSSIKLYEKVIKIDKLWFLPKKNLGISLLKKKEFRLGFNYFESRQEEKNKQEYGKKIYNSKIWNGESLEKKTILILSEGGFGDIIHFARYVKDIECIQNITIYFQTNKKLFHLFRNFKITLLNEKCVLPKHDYHCYIMSLAKNYYDKKKNLLAQNYTIPSNNYIYDLWKKKLDKIEFPKIGVCWHGNMQNKSDFLRSIKLKYFKNIFSIKNINFISLQETLNSNENKLAKETKNFYNFNSVLDKNNNAFEDTIELIKNLDLVITCDTSIAHLSASLNKETWVLLSKGSDWRWFSDSSKSFWYKSIKLFRQENLGDWSALINKVKKELATKF